MKHDTNADKAVDILKQIEDDLLSDGIPETIDVGGKKYAFRGIFECSLLFAENVTAIAFLDRIEEK